MLIYKIENIINGKVYIGLTKATLQYRWARHITESRNVNNTKHLYKSMRKYGVENFRITILAETNSSEELGRLEREYIKQYNSTNPLKGYNLTAGGERNQYDGNTAARLSVDDVIFIRTKYAECKMRVSECYKKFVANRMSFSGFQKVWDGFTWKGIMDEVYTPENIDAHKKQIASYGEDNYIANYTNEEVLQMRKYYVSHTLKETFKKYGKTSIQSLRGALTRGYLSVPVYHKMKHIWTLNGKVIDINEYNPVSTIPGSGE